VLDVGCGGGILTEAMAERGAHVTGIDLADKPLKVAQLHLLESGYDVEYVKTSAEELAQTRPGRYDVVTCMELLEHVPDPATTVRACSALVKPGGSLFFATINRNPKSYLFAVLGAEYVLKLLPRGTHDYEKFIKPSELAAMCRQTGLAIRGVVGMTYNPFTRVYALGRDTDVNYILNCERP
jgi:2-polyprenyl-6-hydroxyphenyl methylase/3-demethylubiquinone-9 3-methyltransferase